MRDETVYPVPRKSILCQNEMVDRESVPDAPRQTECHLPQKPT